MTIQAHHMVIDGRIGFVQEVVPEVGNGTTLVLLHTAGQSGVQWRFALTPLAELGYRVLVPDLPGHGHSEPPTVGVVTDLTDYADWVVTMLDSLGLDEVVLVGCSIGGKITQDITARHPARVRAAISMCAESGPGRAKLHALQRELEDSAAPARTDRTYIGTLAVIGRNVDPAKGELIARMHCREDPLVSTSDLIGWATHDVRELLPQIDSPMMFLAGEDDLWVDAGAVEWAASKAPGATFGLLPGYGHYPMEEMDDFPAVLDGWLAALLDRARA
jgi:pimeloyl-ACP methyl ester carboxylesterase